MGKSEKMAFTARLLQVIGQKFIEIYRKSFSISCISFGGSESQDPDGRPYNGKNPSKIFFSRTLEPILMKFGM